MEFSVFKTGIMSEFVQLNGCTTWLKRNYQNKASNACKKK